MPIVDIERIKHGKPGNYISQGAKSLCNTVAKSSHISNLLQFRTSRQQEIRSI